MARRVVVTGLGVVGAFGAGREALAATLAAGGPHLREVERPDRYHHSRSARLAALVDPPILAPWLPGNAARRMSPPSRFAVAAAKMAVADAGLVAGDDALMACVLASAFGPTSFTEKLLRQILLEGPEAASPYLFTECVANAPAAQAAIAIGAKGPNITITEREAGPLLAVARGAALVASGKVERALVGTSEEISPLLHAVLDRFRLLSRRETARPFDAARDGIVAAEGAALLVLESEDSAMRRGATIHARVLGHGSAFDFSAPAGGWGAQHEFLASALRGALARAEIAPGRIDRIVSSASGTPAGDRLEARTLTATWGGAPLPPVLAPKAATGEYGGGHLAATLLATTGAVFGPTPGFTSGDPDLNVTPHDGRTLPEPSIVLASALAVGGAAAWLILERA